MYDEFSVFLSTSGSYHGLYLDVAEFEFEDFQFGLLIDVGRLLDAQVDVEVLDVEADATLGFKGQNGHVQLPTEGPTKPLGGHLSVKELKHNEMKKTLRNSCSYVQLWKSLREIMSKLKKPEQESKTRYNQENQVQTNRPVVPGESNSVKIRTNGT